jgi:predicted amidophosphoribosyltransferase
MSRTSGGARKLEVACPCCGAVLSVDAELGKVLHHQPPPKHEKAPDLDHAAQLLKKEAERREALFRQGAEDERVKSELLERKFKEAFEKTKDQPTGPPLRDFDLD